MDRVKFVEDTVNMLNAQGCFAISGSTCVYKTEDGKKCAIGLHIPDEMHKNGMSGTVGTLFYSYPEIKTHIESKYGAIEGNDSAFLAAVQQRIHDNRAISRDLLPTLEEAKDILKDYLSMIYIPSDHTDGDKPCIEMDND